MIKIHRALCLVASAAFVASCGGNTEEDQASEAYSAAFSGLTKAQTSAASGGNLRSEALSAVAKAGIACGGGGTIDFTGEYGVSLTGGANVEFNLMVTYKGCKEGELTLDGTLTYTSSVMTSGTTAMTKVEINGTVEYTGSFTKSCTFDFAAEVNAGGGSGSASVSGTVCGVDVAAAGISYSST